MDGTVGTLGMKVVAEKRILVTSLRFYYSPPGFDLGPTCFRLGGAKRHGPPVSRYDASRRGAGRGQMRGGGRAPSRGPFFHLWHAKRTRRRPYHTTESHPIMSSAAATAAGVGKKAVHVKVSNDYVFDGVERGAIVRKS